MAAVLALGDGAAVSHRSAAALWGILAPDKGPIEVTIRGDGGREKRKGITLHRSSTLSADFVSRRQGIWLTKPARTLRDLHRAVPQPVFQGAVRRALDLRLISSADLKREEELTRSKLERLMLGLCRRHRLPLPEVNARVDRFEVDFLWREERVIVETDSFGHHGHRAAFESDRARDARLQALGCRVLRFTWRQVGSSPRMVAASLRAVLGLDGAAPH
jgi:very-short-patch-repair endonuclease